VTFAERLEFLMRQRGTSKYQLAKAIGCHQSNISYWLSGERSPQYRLKKAVADYFNVSLSWLETGEGSSDVLLITMMENNLVPPIPEGQKEKSPTPEGVERIPNYSKLSDTNKAIVDSMIAQLLAAQSED
jgi:transcriptional regulator with XRE-family HTH domain